MTTEPDYSPAALDVVRRLSGILGEIEALARDPRRLPEDVPMMRRALDQGRASLAADVPSAPSYQPHAIADVSEYEEFRALLARVEASIWAAALAGDSGSDDRHRDRAYIHTSTAAKLAAEALATLDGTIDRLTKGGAA